MYLVRQCFHEAQEMRHCRFLYFIEKVIVFGKKKVIIEQLMAKNLEGKKWFGRILNVQERKTNLKK